MKRIDNNYSYSKWTNGNIIRYTQAHFIIYINTYCYKYFRGFACAAIVFSHTLKLRIRMYLYTNVNNIR